MENIKERIRKILALAERGGTEAEAATAMEKALELLATHNLSMGDVQQSEVQDEDVLQQGFDAESSRLDFWQRMVWSGIAGLYFCDAYTSSYQMNGKTFQRTLVIGKPSNIAIVEDVARQIVRLGTELAKQTEGDRVFRNSWKNGFASRICERAREQRAAAIQKIAAPTENNERGLTIANVYALAKQENAAYLRSKGIRTKTSRGGGSRDSEGYNAGRAAGNGASLARSNQLRIG